MDNHTKKISVNNLAIEFLRRNKKPIIMAIAIASAMASYEAFSICGGLCPITYKWNTSGGYCMPC